MFNSSTLSLYTLLPSQIESAAQQLVQESMADPWGSVSPAIYDTARVLLLPPALQPEGSLDFILCNQNDDGSWGGPSVYCLVPSLAATASLLHLTLKAAREEESVGDANQVSLAALRGLEFLVSALRETTVLPDTVAIELIVPALVEEIATTLAMLSDVSAHYPTHETSSFWLNVQECLGITLPPQDMGCLARLRAAVRLSKPLPVHVSHYLEVLGSDLDYVTTIHEVNGAFGGSPAATAAMLARSHAPQERSLAYLSEMATRLNGAQPDVLPITTFERAWIVSYLLQAGVPLPTDLTGAAVAYFRACLGSRGACGGEGLPPDSDDSSLLLSILNDLGYPVEPTCLLLYEADTFFRCYYSEERTPSVGANAHILEAFGSYMAECPLSVPTYRAAAVKISAYLLSVQQENGSWLDKWHASPYYGTACSVLALRRFGVGDTTPALDRALAWVLGTQRDDGSWGLWYGTLEETAHALRMLLLVGQAEDVGAVRQAVLRGERFLTKHLDALPSDPVRTPLWHGKELYEPGRVVRAVILSALYLCATQSNAWSAAQEDQVGCAA